MTDKEGMVPRATYVQMCDEADREMLRAEVAEAKLAKARLVAFGMDWSGSTVEAFRNEIRAALADAPAEEQAEDEPAEVCGCLSRPENADLPAHTARAHVEVTARARLGDEAVERMLSAHGVTVSTGRL